MTVEVDAANARRWDGSALGHYEVWYLTCDHAPSGTGYWIRYTLESPKEGHGEPYACLWFARFDKARPERTFGIHRRFAIGAMTATAEPFVVTIGGNRLTSGAAKGELAGDGHVAAWDLTWPASTAVHRQLPDVMYARGGVGETTVMSPNVLVPVSGTITVDGDTVRLDGDSGGQTHLWGRKHAFAWAWGRCTFPGRRDVVVEALAVKLRRRGVTLPTLAIVGVRMGDELLAMNQFRHTVFNRAEWGTGRFTFRAANATAKIAADFTCRPDDMIVAPYEDPDGEPSFCSNTEIGDGRVTIYRRRGLGWREDVTLVGSAHFEVGSRIRDPAVTKDHVLV